MNRTILLLALFLGVIFIASPVAAAGSDPYALAENDGAMCYDMTGNLVMCSSMGDSSGGNYTSCMALGSKGEQCQDAAQNFQTKELECVGVWRDGKCQCDPATKQTKGFCTYKAR